MHDVKPQRLDPTNDLELSVEDAANVVGGDVKPTADKPAVYVVVKFTDTMITAP
jgi:NOL1/NOP2/fmu family ribosome biogenesis protein